MARPSFGTAVVGLFLLAGLVLLVERLVVTDREAIASTVEDLTASVRAGDFEAVAAALHADYEGEGGDRAGAAKYARSMWLRYRPGGLTTELGEISLDGDRAEAPAEVKGWVIGQRVIVSVHFVFARTADGWRVLSARRVGWPRTG